MSSPNEGPLSGIRVIELARVLAGPWCGQILADMGADVIKIERPVSGDDTRHWGPPFIKGDNGEDLSAAYYHCANRGKRSISVDIQSAEGQETVRRLVRTSDVLIENFKVGGLAKYGLDYESLRRENPALVYCSITGFGQTGPYSRFAGYDFIVQGMSGFMSITGEPDGEPMKAGTAIADLFTGVYASSAINAALVHALKHGNGQHIDMALLDVQAGILANQNLNYLASGENPDRIGNAHLNIAPYQVIEVDDGHMILAVGNDGQFARLCKILALDQLTIDPRFVDNDDRITNREELNKLLVQETKKWKRDLLVEACEANAVPAGPINLISEMFADPQVIARGLRVDLMDAKGNMIPGVRTPVIMSETPLAYDKPSPRLGEHTHEVLEELNQIEANSRVI